MTTGRAAFKPWCSTALGADAWDPARTMPRSLVMLNCRLKNYITSDAICRGRRSGGAPTMACGRVRAEQVLPRGGTIVGRRGESRDRQSDLPSFGLPSRCCLKEWLSLDLAHFKRRFRSGSSVLRAPDQDSLESERRLFDRVPRERREDERTQNRQYHHCCEAENAGPPEKQRLQEEDYRLRDRISIQIHAV